MLARATRHLRLVTTLLAVLGTVGCDQSSKYFAQSHLAGLGPIEFLGGTLKLAYVENPGGFLGFGAGLPPGVRTALFVGLVAGVLAFLLGLAMYGRVARAHQAAALGAILGGGIGNLADRLMLEGVVRDFLNVGLGRVRTGVFNVADLAITVGSVVLLGSILSRERTRGSPEQRAVPTFARE